MSALRNGDDDFAVKGLICATPGSARPYAVVLRRGGVVLRSEPVESLREAQRVLSRLLAEAREWSAALGEVNEERPRPG